jgi:hypothetical protein
MTNDQLGADGLAAKTGQSQVGDMAMLKEGSSSGAPARSGQLIHHEHPASRYDDLTMHETIDLACDADGSG